ncbi:porin family protein [Providencia rettgeri]|nr:porin family protein [Providencia rettgeri]
MKSLLVLSLCGGLIALPTMANADTNKNGVYLGGKMGASIMQLSNQQFVYSGYADAGDNGTKNGASHRRAVFGGGVVLGYNFNTQFDIPVRAELDITARDDMTNTYNIQNRVRNGIHQTRDIKNQVKLNTVMVNAYYDFYNATQFTPYITAGVGLASIDLKTTRTDARNSNITQQASHSHTSNNVAWSVGAGVNYAVNENVDLGLSYRYLDAGRAEMTNAAGEGNNTSKVNVKSNDIMLGITYQF